MAQNQPHTPEQQLLKLIEGQKPGESSPGAGAKKTRGGGLPILRTLAAIPGSLAFWKRRAKKHAPSQPRGRRRFGISDVNKGLVIAVTGLFLYVVFDAAASARNLQRPPSFAPMKELRQKPSVSTVEPLAETSYYLQKISSRDIFKEGKIERPVEQAPQTAVVDESSPVIEDLSLVGISWSSNPDAIIESKSKQRTYFVKRGQDVGDGIKVEAIFKDHVVVTHEDREYELR